MGDVAAALAIDFFAWTQIKLDGKDKIGFVLPAGLTPITPDPIAMLKGAPNPSPRDRFIEFVLSPEGQRLWVLPKGYPGGPTETELLRIPVLPEVYRKYADVTSVLFDPSTRAPGFRHDPVNAAPQRDALKDLYGAIFVDLSAGVGGGVESGHPPRPEAGGSQRALRAVRHRAGTPPPGPDGVVRPRRPQPRDQRMDQRRARPVPGAGREG